MDGGVIRPQRAGHRFDYHLRFLRGGGAIKIVPGAPLAVTRPGKSPLNEGYRWRSQARPFQHGQRTALQVFARAFILHCGESIGDEGLHLQAAR